MWGPDMAGLVLQPWTAGITPLNRSSPEWIELTSKLWGFRHLFEIVRWRLEADATGETD
jgi:hypothetical protein